MKKFLLGTVGLVALGWRLPLRPLISLRVPTPRRPPMIAAVYDWSGFYIGVNGGWGSSRKCWDFDHAGRRRSSPPKVAMTRPAARPVVRSAIAGRPAAWVFGLEAQGNWADFKGSQRQPVLRRPSTNQTEDRCVRPVHRPGRLCLEQRPALRQGRRGGDRRSLQHAFAPAAASQLPTPATTPAGAARSAPASNTASPRTGRPASNTITCSWATATSRFTGIRAPARSSAPTASVRTSISSPSASTTAGVARSSRSTDLR